MQLYVVTCVVPSETQDEGYTAFIKYMEDGAVMDKFDGFELVARLHMPESGELCIICKASNTNALFKHFMFWRSALGCEFLSRPAMTCSEMVEMQKEHNKELELKGF